LGGEKITFQQGNAQKKPHGQGNDIEKRLSHQSLRNEKTNKGKWGKRRGEPQGRTARKLKETSVSFADTARRKRNVQFHGGGGEPSECRKQKELMEGGRPNSYRKEKAPPLL